MSAPPEARDALDRYAAEVRRWGARVNLVGSTAPAALRLHLEDALAAAPHLPERARVADLGSGAGLPGVPIAISRPDVDVTLVEIRERRVHFLRHLVRELDLGCAVVRRRLEAGPEGDPFDVATIRAVAAPEHALALARRWVRPGGEAWIWTREPPAALSWSLAGVIALPAGRGQVLRLEPPVARGTR